MSGKRIRTCQVLTPQRTSSPHRYPRAYNDPDDEEYDAFVSDLQQEEFRSSKVRRYNPETSIIGENKCKDIIITMTFEKSFDMEEFEAQADRDVFNFFDGMKEFLRQKAAENLDQARRMLEVPPENGQGETFSTMTTFSRVYSDLMEPEEPMSSFSHEISELPAPEAV